MIANRNPLLDVYPMVIRVDRCTDGSFCYVAEHPDLPGCAAHSDKLREAKELLGRARIAYLKHLLARDLPVPEPSDVSPEEWQTGLIRRDTGEPRVSWEGSAVGEVV